MSWQLTIWDGETVMNCWKNKSDMVTQPKEMHLVHDQPNIGRPHWWSTIVNNTRSPFSMPKIDSCNWVKGAQSAIYSTLTCGVVLLGNCTRQPMFQMWQKRPTTTTQIISGIWTSNFLYTNVPSFFLCKLEFAPAEFGVCQSYCQWKWRRPYWRLVSKQIKGVAINNYSNQTTKMQLNDLIV